MSKNDIFQKLHESIAKEVGLEPRDVAYFRNSHYQGRKDRGSIEKALLERLPHLKEGKSYRYEMYLKRLDFLHTATYEQWYLVIKEYPNA